MPNKPTDDYRTMTREQIVEVRYMDVRQFDLVIRDTSTEHWRIVAMAENVVRKAVRCQAARFRLPYEDVQSETFIHVLERLSDVVGVPAGKSPWWYCWNMATCKAQRLFRAERRQMMLHGINGVRSVVVYGRTQINNLEETL